MINIITSYQKTLEEAERSLHNAKQEGDIPDSLRQSLCKRAYDNCYNFADSVVNAGQFTRNEDLIQEIQDSFMLQAMTLHDEAFDLLNAHLKLNWKLEAAATTETLA